MEYKFLSLMVKIIEFLNQHEAIHKATFLGWLRSMRKNLLCNDIIKYWINKINLFKYTKCASHKRVDLVKAAKMRKKNKVSALMSRNFSCIYAYKLFIHNERKMTFYSEQVKWAICLSATTLICHCLRRILTLMTFAED